MKQLMLELIHYESEIEETGQYKLLFNVLHSSILPREKVGGNSRTLPKQIPGRMEEEVLKKNNSQDRDISY